MYLPNEALMAVLPLPVRSYATLTRGVMSLSPVVSTAGKVSATGTYLIGPSCESGSDATNRSYRTPTPSVRRPLVQVSCAYRPQPFKFSKNPNGHARTVTWFGTPPGSGVEKRYVIGSPSRPLDWL